MLKLVTIVVACVSDRADRAQDHAAHGLGRQGEGRASQRRRAA